MKTVAFEELEKSDLHPDAVYLSTSCGQLRGEPISRLIPGTGNMGGFRISGKQKAKNWVVLFSTGEDPDWPDVLDPYTGQFIYFGDNKTPGHELHATRAGGNALLREVFYLHRELPDSRKLVPPFFIFQKVQIPRYPRSVQFKGLAVPGYPGMTSNEELIAVWKSKEGQRFQNYRAMFCILDIPVIKRAWLDDLSKGQSYTSNTPQSLLRWWDKGHYSPLKAEPTTVIRQIAEQLPQTANQAEILSTVWEYFKNDPILFEHFAAYIYKMTDPRISIEEITRATVDGGRDAIGHYQMGVASDPIFVDFALEAKCYNPGLGNEAINTVGVRETSRLISRIRNRQFGVLVTTSAISKQAYNEVRSDQHPIIFISGKDIADTLLYNGFSSSDKVKKLLIQEFPK